MKRTAKKSRERCDYDLKIKLSWAKLPLVSLVLYVRDTADLASQKPGLTKGTTASRVIVKTVPGLAGIKIE